MNLIPFGGKTPSNTAAAVSVDANGKVNTKKTWDTEIVPTITLELRNTTATSTKNTEIYCGDCAMISLRVINTLKDSSNNYVPVNMKFQIDYNSTGTDLMNDTTGNRIEINLPGSTTVVTPDDVPLFKYIGWLKMYVKASETPTTGTLKITVLKKR